MRDRPISVGPTDERSDAHIGLQTNQDRPIRDGRTHTGKEEMRRTRSINYFTPSYCFNSLRIQHRRRQCFPRIDNDRLVPTPSNARPARSLPTKCVPPRRRYLIGDP